MLEETGTSSRSSGGSSQGKGWCFVSGVLAGIIVGVVACVVWISVPGLGKDSVANFQMAHAVTFVFTGLSALIALFMGVVVYLTNHYEEKRTKFFEHVTKSQEESQDKRIDAAVGALKTEAMEEMERRAGEIAVAIADQDFVQPLEQRLLTMEVAKTSLWQRFERKQRETPTEPEEIDHRLAFIEMQAALYQLLDINGVYNGLRIFHKMAKREFEKALIPTNELWKLLDLLNSQRRLSRSNKEFALDIFGTLDGSKERRF
ncbi:MAG: hypothetical protein AB1646_22420 [Thermodesulfobacteriota bacterium]